jgi:ribosomal protein S12 methylthiotransferase accessory factor
MTADPISTLYSHYLGLFGTGRELRANGDEPRLLTTRVSTGDTSVLWPPSRRPETVSAQSLRSSMRGTSSGLISQERNIRAHSEALERYCTSMFSEEQFVIATAAELGSEALDLESIPKCSRTELAHPKCPLVMADKTKPIRWVRAISLLDGRSIYLPVVMVFTRTGFVNSSERFWVPITTGCASHVSYEQALVAAICEVIERDALSIVWLQRLSLPKVLIDNVPEELAMLWTFYQRSSHHMEYLFFDATTDLGVPTIHGLRRAAWNTRLTSVVACSTSLNPIVAVRKVMHELTAFPLALERVKDVPQSLDDFTKVSHGATYMAHYEHQHAFRFLVDTPHSRPLANIAFSGSYSDKTALENIIQRFRSKDLDLYAIDLSTDEALRLGMRVVRVIVPGLQPLGFQYRARFLGHPRLYEAPKQMGHPVYPETELNPWPQPFA